MGFDRTPEPLRLIGSPVDNGRSLPVVEGRPQKEVPRKRFGHVWTMANMCWTYLELIVPRHMDNLNQ